MTSFAEAFAKEIEIFKSYFSSITEKLYGQSSDIDQVCRYVLQSPGKNVRPLLCLLAAKSHGSEYTRALPAAVALEFIHTYSLVHDDLPAMDDDDLRRGQATAHKAFNEALAILAGDALLTDAFRILTDQALWPKETIIHRPEEQVRVLATQAGSYGMVRGQALDLHFEKHATSTLELSVLEEIHRHKTGALMGAALTMGAISAQCDADTVAKYYELGLELGLTFQIVDDLIDDLPNTGKSQGKDRSSGKLTYLSFYERSECEEIARAKTESIVKSLGEIGSHEQLILLVNSLCNRRV